MFEESISTSPQEGELRTIRGKRLDCKNKCKARIKDYSQITDPYLKSIVVSVPKSEAGHLTMSSVTIATTNLNSGDSQCELFNPFEDELILAAADRSLLPYSQKKPVIPLELVAKQFKKINEIPYVSTEFEPPGPETQFGISESQFARFCEEAEVKCEMIKTPANNVTKIKALSKAEEILQDWENNSNDSIVKDPVISKTTSVVDAILEDFCQSPQLKSTLKYVSSEESTPVFRFKDKPIRTYKLRKKRARVNIENKFELTACNYTDDDISDSSSGLSIQEDLTQHNKPLDVETVDLNNSIHLSQNLLNLSSYFSQQLSAEKGESETLTAKASSPLEIKDFTIPNIRKETVYDEKGLRQVINNLIAEIILLQSKLKSKSSKKISTYGYEFLGFSDDESKDSDQISENNINEGKSNNQMDITFDVGEELNASSLQYGDITREIVKCTERNNLTKKNNNKGKEVEQNGLELFDDDWNNDWDFLKDYKTQDVLHSSLSKSKTADECTMLIKPLGFVTASNKPVWITEDAKMKAAKLIADIESEPFTEENWINILSQKTINFEKEKTISSQNNAERISNKTFYPDNFTDQRKEVFNMPVRFVTASNKLISVSEAAKVKGAKLISDIESEPFTEENWINILSQKNSKGGENRISFPQNDKKSLQVVEHSERRSNEERREDMSIMSIELVTPFSEQLSATQTTQIDRTKLITDIQSDERFINNLSQKKSEANCDSKVVDDTNLNSIFLPIQGSTNMINFNEKYQSAQHIGTYNDISVAFITASHKPITISESSKAIAAKILDEIEAEPFTESNCLNILSQRNSRNRKIEDISIPENKIETLKAPCLIDGVDLSCKQANSQPLLGSHQYFTAAQHEDLQSAIASTSQRFEAVSICNSIEILQSTAEQSISSPRISKSSRKNLLSLSKRKRYKTPKRTINKEKPVANVSRSIAEKLTTASLLQPHTPTLKRFIDLVPISSTPQAEKEECSSQIPAKRRITDSVKIDEDFHKISWDDCNDSKPIFQRILNISGSSCENITITETNPSPKMRIERLRMYGEPPEISPILVTNKCRPSGLRRGRSIFK